MPYLRGLWDLGASQVALVVKNPPAIQETQETWVPSLGWEDPLKEGSGNPLQYSCLENPRQRSLMGDSQWGCKELDTTEHAHSGTAR